MVLLVSRALHGMGSATACAAGAVRSGLGEIGAHHTSTSLACQWYLGSTVLPVAAVEAAYAPMPLTHHAIYAELSTEVSPMLRHHLLYQHGVPNRDYHCFAWRCLESQILEEQLDYLS